MILEEQQKKLKGLYATSFELYRSSGRDRGVVHQRWFGRGQDADDPLGRMELLATDIGGYVSSLIRRGTARSPIEAIDHLRRLGVLDDPEIKPFLRDHAHEYPDLVRYMQILEKVRCEAIVMLEASLKTP